jgi:hypothetical protein
MGTTTITIKSYDFNRPRLLTIEEFNSYKQIFRVDPNYSLVPKSGFWEEFAIVKWSALAFIFGLTLVAISEVFSFIPGISMMILFFSFLGNANSMINYSSMNAKRKEVFRRLENAIKQSNSYEEFKVNFKYVR